MIGARFIRPVLGALVALVVILPMTQAVAIAGKTCKKVGATTISAGVKYTCVKSGAKRIWRKAATAAPKPAPTPTPTPTQTPTAAPTTGTDTTGIPAVVALVDPKAYPTRVVALDLAGSTLTAPAGLPAAADKNFRIFIADPDQPSKALAGSGIFYNGAGVPWTNVPVASDGTIALSLKDGSYEIDVVEVRSNQSRKRYAATVTGGTVSIRDLTANAQGYFAVTVDVAKVVPAGVKAKQDALTALANEPASTFTATSACQLRDQVTASRSFRTDLSAGFPKVRHRIKSFGNVKALIVPVDFPDVQGKDDTVGYFGPIAKSVRDFYYAQSYGRLGFDFDIVPNWVRMPFAATKYGTGGSVGAGDPNGYIKNVIEVTDGPIDYSKYEAVYVLVPKEMPMSVMGWGPAITSPIWTSTGYVVNGAMGGADMYYNEQLGVKGATWKWMAHETGHAFGFYDEDLDHKSQTIGEWTLMAQSWTNNAVELVAWDRYLQGWLPESQVHCVELNDMSAAGKQFTVESLTKQASGKKAVMVPLSAAKILVIESRKSEGFDTLAADKVGVLVYTVDMTIGQLKGGYRIIKRTGSTDSAFRDGALKTGDWVTVDGVRINVESLGANGDVVLLSRN